MREVALIHWKKEEQRERLARLKAAGYRGRGLSADGTQAIASLRTKPAAAVVIDLSRLPSHGREVAFALRMGKATRSIPLVFVEGEHEKVKRIRALLPDAVYTNWQRIGPALRNAIVHPPRAPIVPESLSGFDSGVPLAKKLGIRAGTRLSLSGAPRDFRKTLGSLPEDASIIRHGAGAGESGDLHLWFVKSRKAFESSLPQMAARVGDGALWICWPKKSSALFRDLTQNEVRRAGLAAGLVDFKVCAVDETWSGLKFSRRRRR